MASTINAMRWRRSCARRRVSDLLGPPDNESDKAGAEMIFTSSRPHTLSQALTPFFGGHVPVQPAMARAQKPTV